MSLSLDDFYHLARATLIKDEAQFDRYDLAFATYFKGVNAIFDIRTGIPEEWLRKEFERLLSDEDKAKVEALGGWDKLHGDAEETARGAARAPRGRVEVDRHRRHEPVRRVRLQPGGRADRRRGRQPQRGEGLGRAQLPQPRRRRRAQHAQHQGRAAEAPALRARRRPRGARPRRHDRGHGEECRLARPAHGPRAAQSREGAAVPRRRRLDGPARAGVRGALLGSEERVPPPRALLFPQLRLRLRLARQPAPPHRARARPGTCCTSTDPTGS